MRLMLTTLPLLLILVFPTLAHAATDTDYENAGEQIMGQMMGSQHEAADQNIKETMGEAFLTQMHIAMGKMAEKNASGSSQLGMMPMMSMMMGGGGFNMMGGSYGMNSGFGVYALLAWVTWILVISALILGIIWLWKQIQKK